MEPNDLIQQIQAAGLAPFKAMTIMVSDGCNLDCRHCWLDCRPLKISAPVAAEKINGAIDAFVQLGGTEVRLTGGEFFSHPQWRFILLYCVEHAGLRSIGIQTNATLLTREIVEFLLDLPFEKITLYISLDGAQPSTHDFVRGAGTFNRAMAGLNLLVASGLGASIEVVFTEMAHNFDDIPILLEMVDRMGIKRLVTSTLVKDGRAAGSMQMQLPRPDQYRDLIQLYQAHPVFKERYDRKANIAALEWFKNRSAQTTDECACLNHLFLDVQGHLYPCAMLRYTPYASKSIYRCPFDSAVHQALNQWREIPKLRRERRTAIDACAHCTGKHHCGGGCMGRAAIHQKDMMIPEDRCNLRQVIYHWPEES